VSSKDPSKMSKSELLTLYKATAAEKEELAKKCGQYSCFFCSSNCPVLIKLFGRTIMSGKVQKKYKHAKKALDSSREPAKRELIPYPSGQTHGRGDFNLAEFLLEHSNVSKEEYNALVVSASAPLAF
jgi:hypothetical protein